MNIIIYLASSYVLSLILMGLLYYIHRILNDDESEKEYIKNTYTKIIWPVLWVLFFIAFL
jgi:hypothetical protein